MANSSSGSTSTALILFAHGSRDPEWAQPFRRIQAAIRTRQPGTAVKLAFLEFMQPTLDTAVSELVKSGHAIIAVAPLFMAQGAHLKSDLTRILDAIRADHPKTEITLLPAIGEVGTVIDTISNWLVVSITSLNR